jgi:tetratricopeptide (TPR) repeat protein
MDKTATPARASVAAWIAIGLIVVVFAIYAQVGAHEFLILDDDQYVTDNGHVRQGLTLDGVRWALASFHAANWHPLTWISHMLDVELFGLDPGAHHLVGVTLHALCAVLLFLALRTMTGATWRSACVAALFAVHPLRVESVAWVAERKDLLAGLFWMTTLWAYAAYVRRPDTRRYTLVLVSFVLGLMSKPMLVTLPFVLLLLDIWPLERRDRPRLLEKLPLFALATASSVVTVIAQRAGGSVSSVESVPFAMRLANAVASYGTYLWKTLLPLELAYFYPHPAGASNIPTSFRVVTIGSAALLALASYFVYRRRDRPWLAVGWLWFLGTLVPVIGLFQVGAQAHADRYTYLPLIGIYIAAVWGLAELTDRQPGLTPVVKLGAPIVLVVLSFLTWHQVSTWKDSRTLFEQAIAVTRDNHVAHTHLGTVLNVAGDLPGAEAQYREALRIEPDYADAHSALGIVFGKRGDLSQAARHFEQAVAAAPRHADAHYNLGLVLRSRGDLDGAQTRFREALRLRPGFVRAWFGLGQIRETRGDRAGALDSYRRALAINPAYEPAAAALQRLQ